MDLGLNGRRAVVAAGTAGLGLAVARALVAEGAEVAVCGRDASRLSRALEVLGEKAIGYPVDLAEPGAAASFVERACADLGGVDVLVANGGGPPAGGFADVTLEQYSAALQQNLLAVVELATAALPHMRRAGWGRFLAITSIAVRSPLPDLILSNTARAGVTGFLKSLSAEVAPDGVTVNSLLPAFHATDRVRALHGDDLASLAAQLPVGRVGDPEEFGSLAAFLCSDRAGFITGNAIAVDGGWDRGLL